MPHNLKIVADNKADEPSRGPRRRDDAPMKAKTAQPAGIGDMFFRPIGH